MAERVRQTIDQKFREEATDEQWLELVDDHDNITGDPVLILYRLHD